MRHRHTPRWDRVLELLLVLLTFAMPARADDKNPVTLLGEGRGAALRLAEARKHLAASKWSEAIEELQTILHTAGNDLVPLTADHCVQAGQLCRIQLASMPADALRLYRQRYEEQTRKKLQQAEAARDGAQLRKIVEEAFCTRAAEKAMDLLGDLAFERGRFDEAEEWWRLLAPLPDARRHRVTRGFALVFPDPSLDPARVQAKQLLALLFKGAEHDWKRKLESYQQLHAKAEGTLAGRKGRYVELLQQLVEERKKQRNANVDEWPTFGGDFSRGRSIPAPDDILDRLSDLCRDGPAWSFNLERRTRQDEATLAPAANAAQARSLAFHPVIVGHQVLLADACHVTAFDLRNGQSGKWYGVAEQNGGVNTNLRLPASPDLRYTLTVAGDHAYVRLGAQNIGAPMPPRRVGPAEPLAESETFLACLSLRPDDEDNHFRWKIDGILPQDNSLFEGAPLVADGLIWIASTRYQRGQCLTAIDCFTANETSMPPRRWRCELCETPEGKAGEPRYRHHLLTLAGTQLVYCSHTGAVVAIDAATGRRNWAIRYPKRKSESEKTDLHDLCPVLFADGRLYVAPADSDTLLCLDPATGRTLWELEPRRVVHLLGVGQGKLIFTTPDGLRAVQADSGNPSWAVPDAGGGLTPAGRGLLIGDLVLFPTTQLRDFGAPARDAVVYALRQSDGRAADDPARLHRLPAGNLAYGNGCLAVADQKTLSVFVPPRLLLPKRKVQAERHADSAAALLELARAEADAGQSEAALRTFHQAEVNSQNLHPSRRKPMLARLHFERQRLLLEMAGDAARAQRGHEAESAIEQAISVPLGPRGRLHALLRAAQIWQGAGETVRARGVWEAIQANEQLRQIQVSDRSGKPMPAAESAAARLATNRGERGRVSAPSGERGRVSAPSGERGRVSAPRGELGALTRPRSPLFRAWHVRLDSNESFLAGWRECDAQLLLTGSSKGHFICRLASTGDIRWQTRVPFAPRWAGCHAETILAAGVEGVSGLRRDNGQLIWHFPAPVADRYPRAHCDEVRVVLDPQPPEPLTTFQLMSGSLYFLQGQRRLFALNADTGAVLWHREAPDAELHLPFPRGCFSSCYHAGAETVLVQTAGRRWLLDAATGRQLHQAADSRELWKRPPLELDERTWCVIPDSRRVIALNARTGQILWEHQSAGSTTLSGELPSVLGRGNLLLLVQAANIGYYLHRLDRATGKSVWPRPQLLMAKSVDVNNWSFDADALYSIEDRSLIARSLANGGILWRRSLPASGSLVISSDAWQARCVGDYLAVSPQASVEARFRFRSPLGRLQWEVGSLAFPETIFPVSIIDPKTGQLVQRLNFRIESPLRTARAKRRTQEDGLTRILRTSSLLASADGPVIRLEGPHPFIAVGGEVWGLTAMK